nr:hypothetical protein [Sedimentibacter sp.]
MEKYYVEDIMPILVFIMILTAILLSGLLCKLFYKYKNKNKLRIVIIIFFIIFNLVNFYIFRMAKYKVPIHIKVKLSFYYSCKLAIGGEYKFNVTAFYIVGKNMSIYIM